jgi:hypothetical protein
LAAVRGRATASAVLLTIAIVAKQTAVLAVLPAALALPKPKLRVLAAPVLVAVVVYGSLLLLRPGGAHLALAAGSFFHPWQVWWLFGVPSDPAWEAAGHGAITSPAWLAPIPHPLIVALAVTGAVWLTFRTFEVREGIAPMLMYLAWTLPLAAALVRTLFARPARARNLVAALA